MKKRILACILTSTLLASVLSGCSVENIMDNGVEGLMDEASNLLSKGESAVSDFISENFDTGNSNNPGTGNSGGQGGEYALISTSLLGGEETIYYDPDLVPSIPAYSVNPDFSNVVINGAQWELLPENRKYYETQDEIKSALIKNNFVVVKSGSSEFFDLYESNRYSMTPNFITVDSLMHTYHLYFAYLMKTSEKNYLANELMKLSASMLEKTKAQYEELKGTEWEEAAKRNLEFFYIGSILQDSSILAPISDSDFDAVVKDEYNKVMEAAGISPCNLTTLNEDYTQYKPRGYYEGDEQLEKYFRAMMWYGRIPFALDNEDLLRSAILQAAAVSDAESSWESIYKITSFFAGKSDDPGYTELMQIINMEYGQTPDGSALKSNSNAFAGVQEAVKKLKMPEINSIPVVEGDDPVIPSFRFMGQRFTIDAAIMQRLIYSSVKENANGDRRYLPDALDTPAALGSKVAYTLLEAKGDTQYENYTDNLAIVSDRFNNDDPQFWNASLYAGWLNTLRPLLEEKGEGYPSYMQNDEWTKKNLETFAGSYAELKHDTILYAKQNMAEMGGGEEEIYDDRGYVDPQPVIYSRFKFLSEKTKEGLDGYGMLSDTAKEDLDKLSEIAGTLLTISEKELRNETLNNDDYEYIRCYGGYLEHFWREVNKDVVENGESLVYSDQAPCPIIADIATDPNGAVLEVGTGGADRIYVVFPIDGKLHVGTGSVYSFYQFTTGISDRLTDSKWRQMLNGGYLDDNWNWVQVENPIEQPQWTQSYRVGH